MNTHTLLFVLSDLPFESSVQNTAYIHVCHPNTLLELMEFKIIIFCIKMEFIFFVLYKHHKVISNKFFVIIKKWKLLCSKLSKVLMEVFFFTFIKNLQYFLDKYYFIKWNTPLANNLQVGANIYLIVTLINMDQVQNKWIDRAMLTIFVCLETCTITVRKKTMSKKLINLPWLQIYQFFADDYHGNNTFFYVW